MMPKAHWEAVIGGHKVGNNCFFGWGIRVIHEAVVEGMRTIGILRSSPRYKAALNAQANAQPGTHWDRFGLGGSGLVQSSVHSLYGP